MSDYEFRRQVHVFREEVKKRTEALREVLSEAHPDWGPVNEHVEGLELLLGLRAK